MRRLLSGLSLGLFGGLLIVGCASQSEVVNLSIPALREPGTTSVAKAAGPTVGVVRFDDKRANKAWLGTLTGRFGGTERFNVRGNDAGQAVANALADYLRSKGWQAVAVSDASKTPSDVIVSGEILEMEVDAKKGFFSTDLTSKAKIALQGSNQADGSQVRMTLTGTGSDGVFWFSPDDAQALVNDVLSESFSKLSTSTKFENKALRLN